MLHSGFTNKSGRVHGLNDNFLPGLRGAHLALAAAAGGIRHFIFQLDGGYFRGVSAAAVSNERVELYHPLGELYQSGF